MDTTKAEPKLGTDAPTLADDSRIVADRARVAGSKSSAPAEIRDHELIRRIGQGSYGEVWLARNVMGTYRAVKIVYRAAFENAGHSRASSIAFKNSRRSPDRTTGSSISSR